MNPMHALAVLCLTAASLVAQTASRLDPDGTRDRTTDIQNSLAAYGTVTLAPGIYYHGGILNINSNQRLVGEGDAKLESDTGSATLLCSSDTNNAVKLNGVSPKLENVVVSTTYSGVFPAYDIDAPNRSRSQNEALVWVNFATNFVVDRVVAHNGRQDGIIVFGGGGTSDTSRARITRCHVYDTMADGIHATKGSAFLLIQNNTVTKTGDDMIAQVSYRSDGVGVICHDNIVDSNTVYDNRRARGITVIGGTKIRITNNIITDVRNSGIHLASELSTYDTYGVDDITLENNEIIRANRKDDNSFGGIVVTGRAGYVANNCNFRNNLISDSKRRAVRIGEDEALDQIFARNILLEDNFINVCGGVGIALYGTENVRIRSTAGYAQKLNNIFAAGAQAIYVSGRCRGSLEITDTHFDSCNRNAIPAPQPLPVVQIASQVGGGSTPLAPVIKRNYHNQTTGSYNTYYIECRPAPSNIPAGSPDVNRQSGQLNSYPAFLSVKS